MSLNFEAIIEHCEEFGLDFEYRHIDDKEVRLIFRKAGTSPNDKRQRVMERVFPLEYKDSSSYCTDFDGTLHYELIHFSHILEADKKKAEECVNHIITRADSEDEFEKWCDNIKQELNEPYNMNREVRKQISDSMKRTCCGGVEKI